MKTTLITTTLIIASLAFLTSCQENEAPTITINSPSGANSPYMSGSSVHIHVNFEDDESLHEAMVTIVREHDGAEVYHSHAHPDAKTYTLEADTMLMTAEHSDFTVTATATDHDEESTTVTETFHMHPM